MKVEYDPKRDLLYVWFAAPGTQAARTEIVSPGVHVDLDEEGRMVGLEVLDARSMMGDDPKVEFALPRSA